MSFSSCAIVHWLWVACVLAIHAQVMGVGRKGLMAAPRPPCAWQHTGNPQLMNSPGGKGWIGREKPHNIGFASIFDNNRVFGCTKDTGSMSVCIRIEGSDGKWWQGKTILCIPNKQSSCFRWQRLADLCIRFFQNKESGCKAPKSKAKTYIPKHRKQGFWWQVFRFGGETYIHNCFKQDCGKQTKRVFGLFWLMNFSNTLLI